MRSLYMTYLNPHMLTIGLVGTAAVYGLQYLQYKNVIDENSRLAAKVREHARSENPFNKF